MQIRHIFKGGLFEKYSKYFLFDSSKYRKNKVFGLAVCLIIFSALFIACDNDNDSRGCVQLANTTGFLDQFEECPTDGLVQVCNSFLCRNSDFPMEPIISFFMTPSECVQLDCFSLECDFNQEEPIDRFVLGTMTDLTVPSVTGTLDIEGEIFPDIACLVIAP